MRPVQHYEAPHLALWKSAVSRVLARELGVDRTPAAAADSDHPLMQAADQHCQALERNQPVPEPDADRAESVELQAYLSYLHHRQAHARIAQNPTLGAQVQAQIGRFKFGNPLWQQMLVQYFDYYWQYPCHLGGRPHYRSWQDPVWGGGDPDFGAITWRLPANARVAIIGDVGTGTDVAAAVLVAALRFRPHAFLHLGDIYYSGTEFEVRQRFLGLLRAVMQSEKARVPVFTVPGNHEYFSGCAPFLAALDSGQLVTERAQRQAASYFCLRTADDGWQFLGLDTGFYGHYMNVPAAAQQAALDQLHQGQVQAPGDTGDPHWPCDHNPFFRLAQRANLPVKDPTKPTDQVSVRADEAAWHQHKLEQFRGRTVLLSHHQLYSALDVCGVPQRKLAGNGGASSLDPADFNRDWINTALWRQFGSAFGDRVAAWLWGHEHNLGIFQSGYRPPDWPTTGNDAISTFKTLPKGRCAGHSAIPVQESESPYAQKYPVPLERPDLKLGLTNGWYNHGFEMLELAGAGHPARLAYYQVAEAEPEPLLLYEETLV